jgi:hypothetical protein
MKKTLLMFFFFTMLFSCKKGNEDYQSIGIITGFDTTKCGCCWGWIININDVSYIIESMPSDPDLNLALETQPVTVKLDWQPNATGCINKIKVQRIKKL